MPIVTRKSMLTLALLAIAGLLIVGGFIWSGIYNVGADDTHTRPVYALLQTIRQRSITSRARSIEVPDLSDPVLIRQGAGNYDSMCAGCHLAPGMEDTELSKGLYPAPPAFTKAGVGNPARHFWVIKHGIKATGMPAWGKSMEDQYIWGMVAFLQQLPRLDPDGYRALVASSGGHSHGGGETEPHGHAAGTPDDHHLDTDGGETAGHLDDEAGADVGVMHTHADGTREWHAAPKATAEPAAAKAGAESSTPSTDTNEHGGMSMPESPPAEHADDGHQH
jgi:mono/diheme cytochrome c family protein